MTSTTATRTYTPQEGSTAWKVIEFLTTNPGEALSPADVEVKFNKPRSQVHSILASAIDTGVLMREEDLKDGELLYKIGKGHPDIKSNPGRNPTLGTSGGAIHPDAAPRQQRRAPPIVIDAAAVPLEDDVPLPPVATGRRPTDWPALFSRMKPGQSVRLPSRVKATLGKAISAYHRDNQGAELATRLVDDEHLRLWRVK